MPLHVERSGPKRPPKLSLDERDSECPRPTKRQQRLPTPPTPDHPLDKAPRPTSLQAVPRTPSDLPWSPERVHEDIDSTSGPASTKRRIEDWLAKLAKSPPTRARSCPPRLEDNNPYVAFDPGGEQRPLLEVLQKVSQSERQSWRQGSAASGRNSRPATSHPDYRSTLRNNGIRIDHTGDMIPQELRSFLDSDILKARSSRLSPEAIAQAVQTAVEIADSPEGNIYDLVYTAMLPIKRSDVGRGGNTPWYPDGLPRNESYKIPLATPKPDVHCGYLTGQRSTWTVEESAVVDHPAAGRLTRPAKGNCFPYFVVEMKSEAMGASPWQAENQAAGSGACCVNIMRWLFREALMSQGQSVTDSIAFSACVTHRQAIFHVHFYSVAEDQNYMSWIGTFETMRQVQECNHIVQNIFDHALGPRQTRIRDALAQLYPIPEHWKTARPASAMDSPNPGADDGDEASNKNQRLE